jgi:hypothetical protein
MTKSRRWQGMWHEWGKRRMHKGYWWESQKIRNPIEYPRHR